MRFLQIPFSVGMAYAHSWVPRRPHGAYWVNHWNFRGSLEQLRKSGQRLCIWGTEEQIKAGLALDLKPPEPANFNGVQENRDEVK